MNKKLHIACDFDRTLAYYHEPDHHPHHSDYYELGPPIPSMLDLVKKLLSFGHTVSIFTARVAPHDNLNWNEDKIRNVMQDWLESNGLPRLDITCIKSPKFDLFIDDKAISIIPNQGMLHSINDTFLMINDLLYE